MSAMNALLGKPASQYNGIEYCIVKTWTNPEDIDERMAEKAAAEYLEKNAELLALRERVAKLEKVEECAKKLIALRGVAHGAWVVEILEAALKSQ